MFRAAERKETITNLQAVQSLVRWDALRYAHMCPNAPVVCLCLLACLPACLPACLHTADGMTGRWMFWLRTKLIKAIKMILRHQGMRRATIRISNCVQRSTDEGRRRPGAVPQHASSIYSQPCCCQHGYYHQALLCQ